MAAKSYTGGTTAATAIQATPATLQSIHVDAAATSVLTLWDNASAASGTILFQKNFPAAFIGDFSFVAMGGLRCANGVTATVATATCEVTLNVT